MRKAQTISVILLVGVFLVTPTAFQAQIFRTETNRTACFDKVSKEDMENLLKDAPEAALKALAESAELKNQQVKTLKQLLAYACAARREGLADDAKAAAELEDLRVQLIAVAYDREVSKGRSSFEPFKLIGEDRVKGFWNAEREAEFQTFLKLKIEAAKENGNPFVEPTAEIVKQARDYFAKTRLYAAEAEQKIGELPNDFQSRTELSIKVQQAQYLANLYSRKIPKSKTEVTDEEIRAYIAAHPELKGEAKKAQAEKVLRRALAGESFTALAAQFSEDPGSKNRGGLYANVTKGMMIPEFEQTALSLKPGQIAARLTETRYGFHIIKLVRRRAGKDAEGKDAETYSVRHILISTTVKDPKNPFGRELPVEDFVKTQLEADKEKRLADEAAAKYPITIAENFEIPRVPDKPVEQTLPSEGNGNGVGEPLPLPSRVQANANVKLDEDDNEEVLPRIIKNHLNKTYRGWKLSESRDGCGTEVNNGVVKGNFDSGKTSDYTVKFTRGKKGFLLAFLGLPKSYKPFVLRNYATAKIADDSYLGVWKKGEFFENGKRRVQLNYDAPADFRCGSDVGGIHLFQKGRFVAF